VNFAGGDSIETIKGKKQAAREAIRQKIIIK